MKRKIIILIFIFAAIMGGSLVFLCILNNNASGVAVPNERRAIAIAIEALSERHPLSRYNPRDFQAETDGYKWIVDNSLFFNEGHSGFGAMGAVNVIEIRKSDGVILDMRLE